MYVQVYGGGVTFKDLPRTTFLLGRNLPTITRTIPSVPSVKASPAKEARLSCNMDHFPILSSSQKPWPDFPALTLEDYDAAQLPYIVQPRDSTRYRLSEKDFEDFPFFWLEDQVLHKGQDISDWDDRLLNPSE